ncbi:5-oxoprolinase subunit C family protein [Alkalihalophilus marmarensis]|uniref:5-oxoprolinase subunit C family protein n=1 Tax=Alkalihalophilus marmarensis TaxID=521377 RepID=UPI002DBAE0B4|nr:biotin-dependent carboxyltransferase family protein [Alkalihalophilus marmarensis]MEC2072288.1 biotin-dependent carboxyltransferase family protein [Alkalihalophilus marmarensis]
MSIKVLRPGLLTTLQDLGRVGYQKYGVIVSGAMDPYSLRIANLLVGNREDTACLEMTMQGATLEVEQDTLMAITGGQLTPSIGNYQIPLWRPVFVKRGSVIRFGNCASGCRTYVAVAGGFDILPVMGSQSTYLRAKIGGLDGRALQEGDVLPVSKELSDHAKFFMNLFKEKAEKSFYLPDWRVRTSVTLPNKETVIRVLPGTHYDTFTEESKERFYNDAFQISPQSDRMGYRLDGSELARSEASEVVSEAVALGTVQVPADGNPIILLADRQTTGGYPRIAQVISVDIPKLAQMKPGDSIQFSEVTLEEAQQLYMERESELKEIKMGLYVKRHEKTPS